jgi:hypothetical protein
VKTNVGKNTYPAMSMSPPTGVTAPRAFLFVITIKYRDPEKRVVPAMSRGGEYCGVFFLSFFSTKNGTKGL